MKKETNKNNQVAISVQGVSKTFRIPHEKISSVCGTVVGALKRNNGYEEFQVYPVANATGALERFID
jgi:hypothetical protein